MTSPDNLVALADRGEIRRKPVLHFGWQPAVACYRIMALMEDGSTRLLRMASNRHELRERGYDAAKEVAAERRHYFAALRNTSLPLEKIDQLRPKVVSLFTERWVGKQMKGSWQLMSRKDGGFCRTFDKLTQLPRERRSCRSD